MAAQGAAFDRIFLEMMTAHHNGAIEMARTEQAEGRTPKPSSLPRPSKPIRPRSSSRCGRSWRPCDRVVQPRKRARAGPSTVRARPCSAALTACTRTAPVSWWPRGAGTTPSGHVLSLGRSTPLEVPPRGLQGNPGGV
jgi:hypothetical protein